MHRNCFNTLNYFSLAVILGRFKIATKLSIEIYKRTQIFNFVMYKTMQNDDLYQKSINPDIKIEKREINIIQFCIAKKLKDRLIYLVHSKLGINIRIDEWQSIQELIGKEREQIQSMSEQEYSHIWQTIADEPKSKLKRISLMKMNEEGIEHKKHQLFIDNYDERIM